MALQKVSLRISSDNLWLRRAKWSNTFYLDTANPSAAAAAVAAGWIAHLRGAARQSIFAYEVYAATVAAGDSLFSTVTIPAAQQRGNLSLVDVGQQYQFNTCVSVELNVDNSRPSRKFWRPGIYENDVINGVELNTVLIEAIRTSFIAFNGALDLLDPDSEPIGSVGEVRLTQRKLGRQAGNDLPIPPAYG